MPDIIVLISTLGSLAAIITSIYAVQRSKKEVDKIEAETTQLYQGMLRDEVRERKELENTVDDLQEKVKSLECEVKKLNKYIKGIFAGTKRLIYQIESKGDTPVWTPKEIEPEYPN